MPKFIEKLEVCRDLFHGFDYSGFMGGAATDLVKSEKFSEMLSRSMKSHLKMNSVW